MGAVSISILCPNLKRVISIPVKSCEYSADNITFDCTPECGKSHRMKVNWKVRKYQHGREYLGGVE